MKCLHNWKNTSTEHTSRLTCDNCKSNCYGLLARSILIASNKPNQKLSTRIQSVEFSNPRRLATFHDWPTPTGPTQRDFGVLSDDSGRERVITWTKGKPRLMAGWHDWARIVDGSDDRTYVVGYSGDTRTNPIDNQGRACRIEGRAVVYQANLKTESAIFESGPMFDQIQQLRNKTK